MSTKSIPPAPIYTEIAYILDRSGSMESMREPAITAFNEFVRLQCEVPGEARLTLVQFDDRYEVPVAALRVQKVPQLTAATYVPRGSTALLDAIGRTIRDLDIRFQKLPAAQQPAQVILAIFTDGFENCSSEYTMKHVSDLIHLYRTEKGWEFLFLAANQDAIATATSVQMDQHLSGNVSFTPKGVQSTGRAMSRKVRAMRMKSSGFMDAQAAADDAKPMNQIIQEEEGEQP